MRYKCKTAMCGLFLGLASLAHAADKPDEKTAADFDLDGNLAICDPLRVRGADPAIPKTDELTPFARYVVFRDSGAKFFEELGVTSAADFEAKSATFYEKIEARAVSIADEIFLSADQDGCVPVAEVQAEYLPGKKKRYNLLGPYQEPLAAEGEPDRGKTVTGPLLIRAEYQDISILNKAKKFNKAKGARVAFQRDIDGSNNLLSLSGALLYPILTDLQVKGDPERTCSPEIANTLSRYSITPSIAFNRAINSRNKKKDKNELVFRGGFQLEFCGGPVFVTHQLTGWTSLATDFDLDAGVAGVEFEWAPQIRPGLGGETSALYIGRPRPILQDWLWYQIQPTARLEYANVIDDGGRAELRGSDDFVGIGGRIELDLWVPDGLLENLRAYAAWTYIGGVAGRPQERQELTTGIEYPLDQFGHFNFTAEYEKGESPLLLEQTDEFNIGFTIKF